MEVRLEGAYPGKLCKSLFHGMTSTPQLPQALNGCSYLMESTPGLPLGTQRTLTEVVHAEPLQGSTVNSPDQWILSWVTSVCHIKTLAGATHLGPHQNYTEDPPEAPWGTTTFWAAETLQLGLKRAETSEMKAVL